MKPFIILVAGLLAVSVAKPSGQLTSHIAAPTLFTAAAPAIAATKVEVKTAIPVKPVLAATAIGTPIVSSQYHSQDGFGQYSFGYNEPLSSRTETKTIDGITHGGYTYLDAEGKIQSVSYVSDDFNGFRVTATNLPIAPISGDVPSPGAPRQVPDSPEVAAVKAAHFIAHEEHKTLTASANDNEAIEARNLTASAKTVDETISVSTPVIAAAAPEAVAVPGAIGSVKLSEIPASYVIAASAPAEIPTAVASAKISSTSNLINSAPGLAIVKAAIPASYSYSTIITQGPAVIPAPIAIAPYSIAAPAAAFEISASAAPILSSAPISAQATPAATAPASELGDDSVEIVAAKSSSEQQKSAATFAGAGVPAAVLDANNGNRFAIPTAFNAAGGITLTAAGVPVETPEVLKAKSAHLAAIEFAKVRTAW